MRAGNLMTSGVGKANITSTLVSKITDLFLPTVCAACGKLGPVICSDCLSSFVLIENPYCLRCGRPQAHMVVNCASCKHSNYRLTQSRACFTYCDALRTTIQRYKFDGFFSLAYPLGQLMVQHWPDWTSLPDLILPIPLHPRRRRLRGFNQALLLAEHLARAVDIDLNENALKRIRDTKAQVNLGPKQRLENVQNAFAAQPSAVKGKHILLIDDVYTTGATLNSAADTLLNHDAKGVSAYCLARVVQRCDNTG